MVSEEFMDEIIDSMCDGGEDDDVPAPEPVKAKVPSEPAFPPFHNPKDHPSGLTKLEYFAALAMQGDLAGCAPTQSINPQQSAPFWVECADQLIKALTAREGQVSPVISTEGR